MAKLHLEEVIEQLGGCGRYQIALGLIVHYMKIIIAFSMLHMVFGAAKPDWWCLDERLHAGNQTLSHGNLTPTTFGYKTCEIPNSIEKCDKFVFDETLMRTVVSQWHLVCDRAWMASTVTSLQMFGVLIGNLACGQVADLIGRKHPLFLSVLALVILNLAAAFAISPIMFAIIRFFIGIAMGFELTVQYNVVAEYTLARWRAWVVSVPSWAVASALLALASWLLADWQHLHFLTAAIGVPILATYWFVPDSFRWQVAHNKMKQAERSVKIVARTNRKPLPDIQQLKALTETEQTECSSRNSRKYSFFDLVRTKEMLRITLLLLLAWLSLGLGGYGIQFAVPNLTGNLYINMFLIPAIGGPLQMVNIYLQNRLGRKITSVIFLVGYFLPSFMVGFSQQFLSGDLRDTTTTVCAIIALTSITAAWSPIQTLTIEVYPTVIRNIGYGFQNTVARVGAIIGPQLVFLESKVAGILYFICGACGILSMLVILPLRETCDSDLHDNLDMEMTISSTPEEEEQKDTP